MNNVRSSLWSRTRARAHHTPHTEREDHPGSPFLPVSAPGESRFLVSFFFVLSLSYSVPTTVSSQRLLWRSDGGEPSARRVLAGPRRQKDLIPRPRPLMDMMVPSSLLKFVSSTRCSFPSTGSRRFLPVYYIHLGASLLWRNGCGYSFFMLYLPLLSLSVSFFLCSCPIAQEAGPSSYLAFYSQAGSRGGKAVIPFFE
jgi:hypothetical protein